MWAYSATAEAGILAEMQHRFGQALQPGQIAGCVGQAVSDLARSISPEALPEMAARLIEIRLIRMIEAVSPAAGSR